MGINIIGLVRNGMNLAMNLTPDIQKVGSYRHRRGTDYVPSTGVSTPVETVATGISFIVTSYDESEVDGDNIQLGDEQVFIRFKDLMLQDIASVDTNDVIDETDGPRRQIIKFKLDPTKQVLTLQCRQIGS